MTDTLLNVFLAIAVDNLANAQELTKVGPCSFVVRRNACGVFDTCPLNVFLYVILIRTRRRKRSSLTRDMPEAGMASYLSKFMVST